MTRHSIFMMWTEPSEQLRISISSWENVDDYCRSFYISALIITSHLTTWLHKSLPTRKWGLDSKLNCSRQHFVAQKQNRKVPTFKTWFLKHEEVRKPHKPFHFALRINSIFSPSSSLFRNCNSGDSTVHEIKRKLMFYSRKIDKSLCSLANIKSLKVIN